jgi:PAS domain S-box-containing protein
MELGQWCLVYLSEGCREITGYGPEDFTGGQKVTFQDLILPEYLEANQQKWAVVLREHRVFEGEYPIRAASGEIRWLWERGRGTYDADGRILFVEGFISDVTERRRAEDAQRQLQSQLTQAQKMESLGSLAGGVAHDMNNVLGAILALASTYVELEAPGSPTRKAFGTIIKAAERGGKMLKGLLNFARQTPAEEEELDVNALLRDEVGLLERTTLAKVQLYLDLADDLQVIRGDASALTSAFMNLCLNAVDAMPVGGTLTLRTSNQPGPWNQPPGWVQVQVQDTGCGMTQEVLAQALNPFFTTKPAGKGTGLGLAMVYSTVKAHQGQMELLSEPGQGTVVCLRFPAAAGAPAGTGAGLVPEGRLAEADTQPQPQLHVLVVDDDDLVRSSLQALLGVLGHRTTALASGEEALQRLHAGEPADVVVLDLNMPGLGGAGTLPRLCALRPGLPVLLATGRADQTALDLVEAYPGVTLLSKPFTMRALERQLAALGQPALA